MEIATDKVDSEIPSPVDGVLAEQCCQADDVVQVGNPVAYITTEADVATEVVPEKPEPVKEVAASPVLETTATTNGSSFERSMLKLQIFPKRSDSGKFYSPLVRTIAKKEGSFRSGVRDNSRFRQRRSCYKS